MLLVSGMMKRDEPTGANSSKQVVAGLYVTRYSKLRYVPWRKTLARNSKLVFGLRRRYSILIADESSHVCHAPAARKSAPESLAL